MPQGRNIESITLQELFAQDTDGNIPILLDIQSDEIFWEDQAQENGHLRVVNNNVAVMFEGKKYLPAFFSFDQPSEDGTKVGDTSITISAIDQRVIEIIRSITQKPIAVIDALFTRIDDAKIMFSKLYHYRFQMSDVTWDGVSAKWKLTFDPAMALNVPVDEAIETRVPAAYEQNS